MRASRDDEKPSASGSLAGEASYANARQTPSATTRTAKIGAVCPQNDLGILREKKLDMRSSPMSSHSAALDDDAFSRSSKSCSISARCRARNSGAYIPRRNPYTAWERVRLVRAMGSRGPELAPRDRGK